MKKFILLFLLLPIFNVQALTLSGAINNIKTGAITPLIGFIIGLGAFFVILGIFKFILKAENPKEREQGKKMIIYGFISLFVMVSVWGLVDVVVNSLDLNSDNRPIRPSELPGR